MQGDGYVVDDMELLTKVMNSVSDWYVAGCLFVFPMTSNGNGGGSCHEEARLMVRPQSESLVYTSG